MKRFDPSQFLPGPVLARLTDIRVDDPDRPLRAAAKRQRRAKLAPDGRLNVLAADHPARRVTRVQGDRLAMADRHDYLARAVRVLMSEGVDGVTASMDVLEDLLVLHDLLPEAGGPPFLHDKLLIASLNRGGLASSSWELDDAMTGPTPGSATDATVNGVETPRIPTSYGADAVTPGDSESVSAEIRICPPSARPATRAATWTPTPLKSVPRCVASAVWRPIRTAGANPVASR